MSDPADAQQFTPINVSNATKRKTVLRLWVWELLLTGFSLVWLIMVARPLAEGERPLGLGQRYALRDASAPSAAPVEKSSTTVTGIPGYSPSTAETFGFAPLDGNKPLRAQWLNRHAGPVLALLTMCGLITLNIGRRISGMNVKQPLIAAFWCIAAHFLGTYSARWPVIWPASNGEQRFAATRIWMVAGCIFLLVTLWNSLRSSSMPRPYVQCKHTVASPWVYPGFVLFSGLGWLWLLDWAARGHLDKQFVGIYQIDSLWLAYAVFALVAAQQGQLLAVMSRLASWLDRLGATRDSLPNGLLLAGLLVWIGLLVAVGHVNVGDTGQFKNYQRHAALLSELMRVPVWLALGWILYRWVEMGQRTARAMLVLIALLAILLAGLQFDHDGGPILAQTIAVVWISSGLVQSLLARKFSWLVSWSTAIATAVVGTAGAIWMAFVNAPRARIDAMALEYRGPLNFLSVMHWLLDAAPAFGFGIGRTPWCGYAHVVGLTAPCRRAGVPDQIQSDYVVSAMLALWGWLPTLLLLTALLLWLWELLRKGPATHTAVLDPDLLRQWIVMGFAVTSGVQIAISVSGTLGSIPLTGLAIPMLSLGGAGLMSTAVFAGLSVNRFVFQVRATAASGVAPPATNKKIRSLA